MADTRMVVVASSRNSPLTTIKTQSFEWIMDEPEIFGGASEGPSPVETMLASVASCFVATGQWVAKELDIVIQDLNVTVEGNIDSNRFLGKTRETRSGFSCIDVKLHLHADAPGERIDKWYAEVMERCPVFDTLQNSTAITIDLESCAEKP